MNEITQELIKNLFDYKDGNLFWKVSLNQRIKIGIKAGTFNKSTKYYQIKINDKQYLTHRLIFLYHNGHLPKMIDHIDNDKGNNKIENLRETTQSQNMMNRKPNKNCSSKYKGVHWSKRAKKWIAKININHKEKFLGYFINELDAAIAYNNKAIELFKEFANLNKIYINKICDNCGKIILEESNFIEYDNKILIFCCENCEDCWNKV